MKYKGLIKRTFSICYDSFDPSQTKLFDEKLILVDNNDNIVGSTSKLNGHLKSMNNNHPHRAFSVFLFNNDNKLLLQKRSRKKVTFPELWSNTCCSHPMYVDVEMDLNQNKGIRIAASRRMEYELGLGNINKYYLLEKVLYRADSDNIFEEYECKMIFNLVDYILLAKCDIEINNIKFNQDEVSDVCLFTKEELLINCKKDDFKITPWFKLVLENKIDDIWECLDNLDKLADNNKIVYYI
jgi:isopentenyl-diphosphate delta-isomerase